MECNYSSVPVSVLSPESPEASEFPESSESAVSRGAGGFENSGSVGAGGLDSFSSVVHPLDGSKSKPVMETTDFKECFIVNPIFFI